VARRSPGEARLLGLWTAGWLALLLVLGLSWLGNWSLQWPVLLVPLAWAAVVLLRSRKGADRGWDDWDERYPSG
jgi:hypothetical protein